MNERSKPFQEEANGIVAQLLGPGDSASLVRNEVFVREGTYIEDVLEEAWQFRGDLELLRRYGLPFPALRLGENQDVPVSLANYAVDLGLLPRWGQRYPLPRPDVISDFLVGWERPERRVLLDLDKASEFVNHGMVDFLATRIASVTDFFGKPSPPDVPSIPLTLSSAWFSTAKVKTTGFGVTVHSSPHLRIHVSPSFRINWRYFGAPSTPTVGTLTGAIYRFAADGGSYATITPDTGTFDIPYQTVSPVLNL